MKTREEIESLYEKQVYHDFPTLEATVSYITDALYVKALHRELSFTWTPDESDTSVTHEYLGYLIGILTHKGFRVQRLPPDGRRLMVQIPYNQQQL